MSSVRKSFGKLFNWSSGVLDLIMKSWSDGTTKQYGPHLRRWFRFCSENELQPLNADVSSGAELLTQYFFSQYRSFSFFIYSSSSQWIYIRWATSNWKSLTRNVQRKTNFPSLHCYIRLCQKMFYFQWNVIRIDFKNFGNNVVRFKWTKITDCRLFIHRLYVPQ